MRTASHTYLCEKLIALPCSLTLAIRAHKRETFGLLCKLQLRTRSRMLVPRDFLGSVPLRRVGIRPLPRPRMKLLPLRRVEFLSEGKGGISAAAQSTKSG